MNLTLALPSLPLHTGHRQTPAFNQMLRYGRWQPQPCRPSEFYRRHLWQGSILQQAKRIAGITPDRPTAFASPFYQEMGMHSAGITAGRHLAISPHEAQRWCAELSSFYQDEHWEFVPLHNDLWLALMPSENHTEQPDWQVTPVPDIGNQISPADQACGNDAPTWLAKQTEIQMWLHQHPLNAERHRQGLQPVNVLWLWQDLTGNANSDIIFSNSPWAAFSPTPARPVPDNFGDLQQILNQLSENPDNFLILQDDFTLCGSESHTSLLQHWEQTWFAPLWQALNQRRLHRLTLATEQGTLHLTPRSHLAFWRTAGKFERKFG
ncbi:hypothetical protein L4G92_05720 [Neisseria sp. ZJ106]|uniref:Regulatory protein, RpfE type n=1 Tax=Neisseria lisongii TaxID=2912188 RepID=A0ABY7RHC6_9NEIS|nr:hypothetical protein [Neisseria lisongii]MCF7521544.1 hypothetical protein [Neisseria lisongii]WCL71029.1 hypothetical protein PJU73_06615 [Neisseria lisongii]